jgi:PAS domain S-box-containing protein
MNPNYLSVIFVVEDNAGDARLLHEMFKEQRTINTTMTFVGTMKEAEAFLAEARVDVILLDLGLPDAQGLDGILRCRAAAPRAPIVVLTGMDDDTLAGRALQAGAQDYLVKGQIDASNLHRALRYAAGRKSVEDALFAEKERAQVTLNCIGDAVACTDIAGNLTFLNFVAENLTGWSCHDAIGRPMAEVFQIVGSADDKAIPDPIAMALARGRPIHIPPDAVLIRRDGFHIPIEDSVAPIRDRAGEATGAVIVLRDVSVARAMALRLAHAASDLARQNSMLSRVNGELATLVRCSPIAIYATDPSGIVTMWSPAAERLSGFSREEAVGSFLPVVPKPGIEDVKDRIGRVCRGEPTTNFVVAGQKKDGATIELNISMGQLIDELGVPRGVISLAENVTEAASERAKIARMQSEFVSTVSHELRTPLTSIGGSLGLIAGGAAGAINAQATRLVEIANKNAQRLIRLVNDILDIEKLQSGHMTFNFAPIRLDEIVEQAVDATVAYAATFGIEIYRLSEAREFLINADPDRVNQAVTNLISNAVKFSPADSRVEVRTSRVDQGVRISISDEGAGIPEEFRARIFQRFAQADSTDVRQKGGSGLGLSIVRAIMERHGGSVSFDSILGVGTCFHLDFPAIAEAVQAPPRVHALLGAA